MQAQSSFQIWAVCADAMQAGQFVNPVLCGKIWVRVYASGRREEAVRASTGVNPVYNGVMGKTKSFAVHFEVNLSICVSPRVGCRLR